MTNYNDKMVSCFHGDQITMSNWWQNEVNTNLHGPDCDAKAVWSNVTTSLGRLCHDVRTMGTNSQNDVKIVKEKISGNSSSIFHYYYIDNTIINADFISVNKNIVKPSKWLSHTLNILISSFANISSFQNWMLSHES